MIDIGLLQSINAAFLSEYPVLDNSLAQCRFNAMIQVLACFDFKAYSNDFVDKFSRYLLTDYFFESKKIINDIDENCFIYFYRPIMKQCGMKTGVDGASAVPEDDVVFHSIKTHVAYSDALKREDEDGDFFLTLNQIMYDSFVSWLQNQETLQYLLEAAAHPYLANCLGHFVEKKKYDKVFTFRTMWLRKIMTLNNDFLKRYKEDTKKILAVIDKKNCVSSTLIAALKFVEVYEQFVLTHIKVEFDQLNDCAKRTRHMSELAESDIKQIANLVVEDNIPEVSKELLSSVLPKGILLSADAEQWVKLQFQLTDSRQQFYRAVFMDCFKKQRPSSLPITSFTGAALLSAPQPSPVKRQSPLNPIVAQIRSQKFGWSEKMVGELCNCVLLQVIPALNHLLTVFDELPKTIKSMQAKFEYIVSQDNQKEAIKHLPNIHVKIALGYRLAEHLLKIIEKQSLPDEFLCALFGDKDFLAYGKFISDYPKIKENIVAQLQYHELKELISYAMNHLDCEPAAAAAGVGFSPVG